MTQQIQSILFVCLGNICRSPTAEGVFRAKAQAAGLDLQIDSCGTAGWHIGKSPDPRARATAAGQGYDLNPLRARQVTQSDFEKFDLILAMDQNNLNDLRAIAPCGHPAKLHKFTDILPPDHPMTGADVPDPYYEDNFGEVLALIEEGSDAVLTMIAAP
ncbi:MAG: low molecular weight protein-tyrosine-phosphatase [Pseudomonadota bacterium]